MDLMRETKADIVCLQETKCEEKSRLTKAYPFSSERHSFALQPSMGLSGGLVTIWNLQNVQCIALAQSRCWIWITFATSNGLCRFHVVNVYSPLDLSLKKELWEEIGDFTSLIDNEPLTVVGDFNSIRREDER